MNFLIWLASVPMIKTSADSALVPTKTNATPTVLLPMIFRDLCFLLHPALPVKEGEIAGTTIVGRGGKAYWIEQLEEQPSLVAKLNYVVVLPFPDTETRSPLMESISQDDAFRFVGSLEFF